QRRIRATCSRPGAPFRIPIAAFRATLTVRPSHSRRPTGFSGARVTRTRDAEHPEAGSQPSQVAQELTTYHSCPPRSSAGSRRRASSKVASSAILFYEPEGSKLPALTERVVTCLSRYGPKSRSILLLCGYGRSLRILLATRSGTPLFWRLRAL